MGELVPHEDEWELLTEAQGQAEKENFSVGDTHGSRRGHADTAVRVEEPEFMA